MRIGLKGDNALSNPMKLGIPPLGFAHVEV
jgi:hypothetical protein